MLAQSRPTELRSGAAQRAGRTPDAAKVLVEAARQQSPQCRRYLCRLAEGL